MPCLLALAAVALTALAGLTGQNASASVRPKPEAPAPATAPAATINKYCVTCHNDRLKTGGLTLAAADVTHPAAAAETWEKVVRKLRTGAMPPAGAPRPDRAQSDTVAPRLEGARSYAAAAHPM